MAWVINVSRDQPLGQKIEVANRFLRRFKGLIGRSDWDAADGLWIEPCSGVHAFGMKFPIEVVLVDEELRVLFTQTLSPWRIGKLHLEARAALEVPLGTLERTGTSCGDQLALHRTCPKGVRVS